MERWRQTGRYRNRIKERNEKAQRCQRKRSERLRDRPQVILLHIDTRSVATEITPLPDSWFPLRSICLTKPPLSVLIPLHRPTGASLSQPSLLFHLAPPVEAYSSSRTPRSNRLLASAGSTILGGEEDVDDDDDDEEEEEEEEEERGEEEIFAATCLEVLHMLQARLECWLMEVQAEQAQPPSEEEHEIGSSAAPPTATAAVVAAIVVVSRGLDPVVRLLLLMLSLFRSNCGADTEDRDAAGSVPCTSLVGPSS